LTELQSKDGKNVFVAIELDATKQFGHEFLEVNDVLTIHGREEENIVKPILENDSLVWVDKEKGHNWLSSAKSNSQAITNDDLDIAAKIIQDFDNSSVLFTHHSIPSTSSSDLYGLANQPVFLCSTISEEPPTLKEITGLPQKIDSSEVVGKFSIKDGFLLFEFILILHSQYSSKSAARHTELRCHSLNT
jgi:hypothetical protein